MFSEDVIAAHDQLVQLTTAKRRVDGVVESFSASPILNPRKDRDIAKAIHRLDDMPVDTVRKSLYTLVWEPQPSRNELAALNTIIAVSPQLSYDSVPLQNKGFSYYGREVIVNSPQKSLPVDVKLHEVSLGLLSVISSDGSTVGFIDVRPHTMTEEHALINAELKPANEFFAANSFDTALSSLPPEEIERYLTSSKAELVRFLPRFNTAALPIETSYYLWNYVRSLPPEKYEHYQKIFQQVFSVVDTDILSCVRTLKGSRESVDQMLEVLHRHSRGGQDISTLVRSMADAEDYIYDAGVAITPPEATDRLQIRERISFLQSNLSDLAHETFMSLDQNKIPFSTVANYHSLGIDAYKEMVHNLYNHFEGIDTQLSQFHPDELWAYDQAFAQLPHTTETHTMLITHWIQKALVNQKGISTEERKEWLHNFYKHVISLGVYNEKAHVYVDVEGTEQQRFLKSLIFLFDQGYLPPHWKHMSVGCGDAMRVEAPVFAQLRDQRPEAYPSEIVGIDMAPPEEIHPWEGMQYAQVPVESLVSERPRYQDSFDLIAAHGSPFNNMNLIREQILYFMNIGQCLKPGEGLGKGSGIFMMETGTPQLVTEWNQRAQRMRAFTKLFPTKPYGSIGVLPAYHRPEDDPSETGAFLYWLSTLEMMGKLGGLKLCGPYSDSQRLQDEISDLQDPQKLKNQTLTMQNAYINPFYMGNPTDWKPGDPVNARMAVWFVRDTPQENPFISSFLDQQPPPVDHR